MRIQNLNLISPQRKQQSFKSNITFDIGGSQREGSCKIYYATSHDDVQLCSKRTTVNKLGKTQFDDSDDFIEHIVDKVKKIQDENRIKIKEKRYKEEENILQSMTLFVPSYTVNDFAYYLPNHRDKENKPLKDLDFSNIRERLKNKGVEISPNMRFRVLQDAMGTGLAVTKKLYDAGMLKKGKYYTACITGGGCGVSNIEMTDDNSVIIKSTGSGYLSESLELKKVSKAGASAPAVIRNFCRAFGLNEEMVEDIQNCHKAEFVLENPVTYEKDVKTEKLAQLLLDTGKYELINEDEESNKITLKVKNEYMDLYNRSRRNAIDKYCLAFARLAIIKKTEGSNGLIITGPLARAIDKVAKNTEKIGISEWVKAHLLGSFNTYELEKMQKTYGFEVICDERFFLDDNTACKNLAHRADFISPNRGNWIKINVKELKDDVITIFV